MPTRELCLQIMRRCITLILRRYIWLVRGPAFASSMHPPCVASHKCRSQKPVDHAFASARMQRLFTFVCSRTPLAIVSLPSCLSQQQCECMTG